MIRSPGFKQATREKQITTAIYFDSGSEGHAALEISGQPGGDVERMKALARRGMK
jgi:hypothetical protein